MARLVASLVASLVQRVRDAVQDEDPALRWLTQGGSIDALDTETALHAVEAALHLGRGDLLAQVKDGARNKEVRKAAGAAIHKLKSMGQKVEEVRSAHSFTLAKEEAPEMPPIAFLSRPDHEGTFSFLTLVTGDAETVVFAGIAGGAGGFRDVDHTHFGRARRRAILDDARKDEALVELPFHVALQLLERAFALGGRTPHEWDHLLIHLDEGTKTSARVLQPFPDVLEAPHADVLAQIVPLFDGPHALLLLPDVQPLMRAAVEVMGADMSPIEVSDEDRQSRKDGALDQAADDMIEGFRRQTWALALEVHAVFASHRGWEDLIAPARHTALALTQGWRGRDIPYIRELASRLVDAQLDQLRGLSGDGEEGEPELLP